MQWDRIEAFARKGPETQAPGASKAVPANTQIAELDQKRAAKVVSRAQTRKLLIEAGFDLTKVRL